MKNSDRNEKDGSEGSNGRQEGSSGRKENKKKGRIEYNKVWVKIIENLMKTGYNEMATKSRSEKKPINWYFCFHST